MKKMRMKSLRMIVTLALAISFGSKTSRAQYSTIFQEQVSISRALAGHANFGLLQPADGITVELCSSDWLTVLASTKTDKDGYFSLGKSKPGKLFYIRLSAPGVDPYELRVRIDKHGAKELHIHLENAT